jgi:hypothetical protein
MRISPLLAALAALAAAAAALAIPAAWSASSPPQLNAFTVSSVKSSLGGLKLAVGGTINCSAKAHYHVWLWIDQSSTGALAHVLLPGSLPSHPTAKQKAKFERAASCTGSAKRWSVKTKAEGTHPAKFAKGAAQACWVVTVSHSRRYALQSNCSNVTVG